ncbi:hypothetical protein V1264_015580 [Littorina saxatilis]|uniref:C-type lectin domain-containing protein n=1 Tax=Littorina saxatilis TaxID=31220 RepID=A0AAN9BLT7_9CAEN
MASGWAYFELTSADRPSANGTRQERYAVDHESMTSYRVVTSPPLSWLAARDACNDSNEMLAVLEPVERATFVTRFLRENKKAIMGENDELFCFVGASRPANAWNSIWPASGPDFMWLDGQPVNLTTTASFWADGRPNNLDENDNVLSIKATTTENFRWDDYDDFEKNCYICQRQ